MIKVTEASPVLGHFDNNSVTLEMGQTRVDLAVDKVISKLVSSSVPSMGRTYSTDSEVGLAM